MRKQLLIAATFLSGFLAKAQTDRTDLEINQLRGKIRSATEITYEVVTSLDAKGKMAKKEFMEFNTLGYKTQYETEDFTRNWGKKIKAYRYENNSRLVEIKEESKDIFRITKIQYNPQGKIETVEFTDNKGYLEQRQKYKYDAGGLLIQIDVYDSDGTFDSKTVNTHNAKKQLIKKEIFNAEGKITWLETFSYDERGNLVEQTSQHKAVPTALPDSRKFRYNEKKQKIEEHYSRSVSKTSELGRLDDFDSFYEYNEHGDMVSESWGAIKDTIVYTYDQHNNWIKSVKTSTVIFTDDKKYEIVERQFKYY